MEDVAIKVINMDSVKTGHSMEDMRKEISIISKCHHKNVLQYYVSFIHEKELWLVMPLIQGGNLSEIIKLQAPKGIKDEVLLASILKQVVDGLVYFHSKGLIHRDHKAENILINDNG